MRYSQFQDEVLEDHHIDDENKEIRSDIYVNGVYDRTFYNIWVNGNCTYTTASNGWYHTFNFYQDILNPKFNAHKFMKEGFIGRGSVNYLNYTDGQDPWDYELFIVEESLNSYPTLITTYVMGEPNSEYTYEYYTITDISENNKEDEKVISISYYNLLGQEIEKPERGFYIEMKRTSKGFSTSKVFQTKH